MALRQELKRLRYQLAVEKGMSPRDSATIVAMKVESILSDSALQSICDANPQDLTALGNVKGMNSAKVEKLGDPIISICKRFGVKRPAGDLDKENDGPNAKRQAGLPSAEDSSEPPPATRIELEQLNEEQKKWAAAALAGESLFLTGEAGTGKSFLLNYIIQQMKDLTREVAVTATTGLAAAALGGVTVHAFAGVGLGKGPSEKILAQVRGNMGSVARWLQTEVLVIDEISMMDADLFTLLDQVARKTRGTEAVKTDKPFGGLQLVLCGDFLQLPPVETSGFAFESPAWAAAKLKTAELQTPVRQQGDREFLKLLSEVRVGICSPAIAAKLATCSVTKKPPPTDNIQPTRLYCTNRDVDAENAQRLAACPGELVEIVARDTWKDQPSIDSQRTMILNLMESSAPITLKLKIGAQVIITQNRPVDGVVNGTRGVVEAWVSSYLGMPCPSVRIEGGRVVKIEPSVYVQSGPGNVGKLSRVQLPLKLGWALTVHRAQGCTLSRAELQLDNAFAYGQAYVALSRVTSMAGLWVRGKPITQTEVKAHPNVLGFYFDDDEDD